MNRNFQKEMEKIIEKNGTQIPSLLLHSCCAPCSTYALEYLRKHFFLTVFYYNPNIYMDKEYQLRMEEQKRLIVELNRALEAEGREDAGETGAYPIGMIEGEYHPEDFYAVAKGLENCPEGGERCFACYELRLRQTAKQAKEGSFDYFTTTLTISPLKNAAKLNEIGEQLGEEYGVSWLPSDLKKKEGYKRSIELSAKYNLYRQDYCGCVYSKRDREMQK